MGTKGTWIGLAGVAIFAIYLITFQDGTAYMEQQISRTLLSSSNASYDECFDATLQPSGCVGFGSDTCKKLDLGSGGGILGLIATILGLLYMFIGIAIVCDELFVPALEAITIQMNLSPDVAGATLMAAGGSAPELVTSFVGSFKRSDVGFGTIVGSAVFNVMFVIGMCVVATPADKSPLELHWYPLARDCSYYVLTLITLVLFMMDGNIYWWEALIQFSLYFGYILVMAKSAKIEEWFENRAKGGATITPEVETDIEKTDQKGVKSLISVVSKIQTAKKVRHHFRNHTTFRAGLHQLLSGSDPLAHTAGVACVVEIQGDVNQVFKTFDKDNNDRISMTELKTAFLGLGHQEFKDEEFKEIMAQLDPQSKGYATKADFTLWYTQSRVRLEQKARDWYGTVDVDNDGKISWEELEALIKGLGHERENIGSLIEESKIFHGTVQKDITFDQFFKWYEQSTLWHQEQVRARQATEAQKTLLQISLQRMCSAGDKKMSCGSKLYTILTFPLILCCAIVPDCRIPGKQNLAWLTMLLSVALIGGFSMLMVELAEIFGKTVGIPDVIMGLTILAAGTSAPDLLSSVIVAQQGRGDTAVSSSIGSNIFDVAFGLPFPWLCFSLFSIAKDCLCENVVEADGLVVSLVTLLLMIVLVVIIIHCSGWKMTKLLGYLFFFFYLAYVVSALIQTPAEAFVVEPCSPFNW